MFGLKRKDPKVEAAQLAAGRLEIAAEALAQARDAMTDAGLREFGDLIGGVEHARTTVEVLYTLAGKVADRLDEAGGEG